MMYLQTFKYSNIQVTILRVERRLITKKFVRDAGDSQVRGSFDKATTRSFEFKTFRHLSRLGVACSSS